MEFTLNQDSPWHFINGNWGARPDGNFAPAVDVLHDDDNGLQGYRLAFHQTATMTDLEANFTIVQQGHSDIGLIFRAIDSEHFYVLHFPDCGQASRARNYWVAVSEMRGNRVVRLLKLQAVPRVASFPYDIPHTVQVSLKGCELRVLIDGVGTFEFSGVTNTTPGRIGVMSFRTASFVQASVRGEAVKASEWKPAPRRRHWFRPVPPEKPCWQKPTDLLRLPNGELAVSFGVQFNDNQDGSATATYHLSRSTDNGKTWTAPEPLMGSGDTSGWYGPRLHVTPAGRLIAIVHDSKNKRFSISESKDNARSWSPLAPCSLAGSMPHVPELVIGPQGPINLADGSILVFLYGGHDLKAPDLSIYSWGSVHCQAYATLSTDDGQTWSTPVCVDGLPASAQHQKPGDGNLDLTEVSGVQYPDGRILALIRPVYGAMAWETWSRDGGKTWSACVPGPFTGYAMPNILRTRGGTTLVAHRMPGLTIHCSHDDGTSWDQGTMIDSGLWAMGGMIEVEPDIVLYIYWDSFMTPMRAQRLRVTRDGLIPL